METSQILLNNGIAFLAIATGIMLVVVGGFLIKLIVDLSKLAQNVDETTTVVRNELRPTMRELNESLCNYIKIKSCFRLFGKRFV